jgi:hypothetical protein
MHGAGINKMRKCHLLDPPESLVVRMGNDVQDQRIIYRNKTVYRVVNYFPRWHADEMLNLACAIAKVYIR